MNCDRPWRDLLGGDEIVAQVSAQGRCEQQVGAPLPYCRGGSGQNFQSLVRVRHHHVPAMGTQGIELDARVSGLQQRGPAFRHEERQLTTFPVGVLRQGSQKADDHRFEVQCAEYQHRHAHRPAAR